MSLIVMLVNGKVAFSGNFAISISLISYIKSFFVVTTKFFHHRDFEARVRVHFVHLGG